jgi:hypothetical protein
LAATVTKGRGGGEPELLAPPVRGRVIDNINDKQIAGCHRIQVVKLERMPPLTFR